VIGIRLDDRPLDQVRLLATAPVAEVAAVDVATVTVIVNGPVSVEDTARTTAGTSVDVDVAANDTGTGGFCLVVPPGQAMAGTARVAGEGDVVRYTPAPGFVGTDAFTYAYEPGCESDATVAPATVTVTVTAPEAADDAGRTLTGPVGGLRADPRRARTTTTRSPASSGWSPARRASAPPRSCRAARRRR
jgi:hypothetical protein